MRRFVLLSALLASGLTVVAGATVRSPEETLGHPVGADRKLAPYSQVLDYLRGVAAESPRVSYEVVGESTLGEEMSLVVLTSESNQGQLEEFREIARALANGDRLGAEEARRHIDRGKVVALVTCTIHSTEVGCTQMAMEFVWQFATTEDPDRLAWMEDVVLLLMPSLNPDGQVMVIDWYERHLGTEHEGGPMPWLYQHYVGHDNNRDFYMLTQEESRVLNDVLYHRWFPQVFVDEHQMGSTGPRMFVPPQADPLAPEVHSLIFRQADLIGTNMSFRLEEAGQLGVGHDMIFDSYWPGGTRNTAWWKNVTGLLTEVASVRIATPIYIDPGELRGGNKGFPKYQRRSNFPSPWPGGWWRLRDIVDYELTATWALVEAASNYRREILANFHRVSKEAAEKGGSEPPYGWVISPRQHDPVAAAQLVELLLRHGVRVATAESELKFGNSTYPPGSTVIPADQPYREFLVTMLRPQRYPEVAPYAGGPIFPPYDVTSWSLPISMGVTVAEIDRPLPPGLARRDEPDWPGGAVAASDAGYRISHAADSAPTAANRLLEKGHELFWLLDPPAGVARGDLYLPSRGLDPDDLSKLSQELHLPIEGLAAAPSGAALRLTRAPRVGLYKPWVASMDEGWTRFLLERYEFPYVNLDNATVRDGGFRGKIDVLLLPDVPPSIIETGEPEDPMDARLRALPEKYAGGLGEEGGKAVLEWVHGGGTLVALDSSADYVIELFGLPVENVLAEVEDGEFVCPGSMLRLEIDTDHPLGFGLRRDEVGYFASSPAFRTHLPDGRFDRRVIARYPDDHQDVLVSGYLEGAELLTRRAAVIEFEVGKGRIILIGFRAQHRAQPHRTFKLLWNALYSSRLEKAEL